MWLERPLRSPRRIIIWFRQTRRALWVTGNSMTQHLPIPGWFLRFIGVCEVLGAFGLILSGILRVGRFLTPLAACALILIMIGAVVVSLLTGPPALALIPLITGVAIAFVAHKR